MKVLAATLLLVASTGIGAYGAAKTPSLRPGEYRQRDLGSKTVMHIGNRLIFKAVAGRLAFSLDAVRASDLNTGFTSGSVPLGVSKATWTDSRDGLKCRLTFAATASGVTIAQDFAYGDCGFGYGVHADGTYARTGPAGALSTPQH